MARHGPQRYGRVVIIAEDQRSFWLSGGGLLVDWVEGKTFGWWAECCSVEIEVVKSSPARVAKKLAVSEQSSNQE